MVSIMLQIVEHSSSSGALRFLSLVTFLTVDLLDVICGLAEIAGVGVRGAMEDSGAEIAGVGVRGAMGDSGAEIAGGGVLGAMGDSGAVRGAVLELGVGEIFTALMT